MADQQEGATGGERAHRVAERRRERLGRQLQVEDRHQVEPGGGGRYVVTSARIHTTLTWCCWARWWALSRPTREKSTPVTSHPWAASQTASRPSPQARSSARPGAKPFTSATRKRLGSAVQISSAAA